MEGGGKNGIERADDFWDWDRTFTFCPSPTAPDDDDVDGRPPTHTTPTMGNDSISYSARRKTTTTTTTVPEWLWDRRRRTSTPFPFSPEANKRGRGEGLPRLLLRFQITKGKKRRKGRKPAGGLSVLSIKSLEGKYCKRKSSLSLAPPPPPTPVRYPISKPYFEDETEDTELKVDRQGEGDPYVGLVSLRHLARNPSFSSQTLTVAYCASPDGGTVGYQGSSAAARDPSSEPRFFFGLCPVSLRTSDLAGQQLRSCSGCLSVSYAGRDEQKRDWKRHKKVCKLLQREVQSQHAHPLSERPEQSARIRAALESSLGRTLTQFETDMIVYPRLCAVCLKGDQSQLTNCPSCHCVSYCSQAHREEDEEEHAKSCDLLRVCLNDHAASAAVNDGGGVAGIVAGYRPEIRSTYSPLPANMEKFLRTDLEDFWSTSLSSDKYPRDALLDPCLRHLSFRYTCPLSVLHGLECSGRMASAADMSSLTVQVVGARSAESRDLAAWELLSARLPGVARLTVAFVGPELSWDFPADDFEFESPALKRVRPQVKIRYLFKRCTYEAVKTLPKPDVVAALNCGFIFYKSWDASIPAMLLSHPGVPLVFTEYYLEDCQFNLDKVRSLVEEAKPKKGKQKMASLEVLLAPSENPYCSLMPARIPTGFAFRRFKRRSIVMSNDFMCVVAAAAASAESGGRGGGGRKR